MAEIDEVKEKRRENKLYESMVRYFRCHYYWFNWLDFNKFS